MKQTSRGGLANLVDFFEGPLGLMLPEGVRLWDFEVTLQSQTFDEATQPAGWDGMCAVRKSTLRLCSCPSQGSMNGQDLVIPCLKCSFVVA